MTEYQHDIMVKTVMATLQSLIEYAEEQDNHLTADWLRVYLEETEAQCSVSS